MKGFSRMIKNVLSLFSGGDFGVYICQNSLACALKMIPNLGWITLQFLNFTVVCKQYTVRRNVLNLDPFRAS